jgi:hypothetical protein
MSLVVLQHSIVLLPVKIKHCKEPVAELSFIVSLKRNSSRKYMLLHFS